MVPDHFSSTNDLIQGIEKFIKEHGGVDHRTFRSQPSLDTGGTLHVIHRLDESSSDSGAEVQRLRKELIEKEKRINELETRESHFTQEIDRLQCNMDELKEQFENYCRRNEASHHTSPPHPPGDNTCSNQSGEPHSSSRGSTQSETPGSSVCGLVMTPNVIQHFNTLGIDLKSFYSQMIKGDTILPPFNELPRDFQRHKSTKAARSKRAKILEFMNAYPNGPQACIANYGKLTASKLYDSEVKQSK